MYSLTASSFPVPSEPANLDREIEWRVTQRTADLAASRAELQDFLEHTHDLVQSVSLDGRFRFVNQAWRRTLGFTAAETETLNLFDLIAPDCLAAYREALHRLIVTGEPQRLETAFRTRDGVSVALVGSVHLRYEKGVPAFTRAVFHDVTEHKRAEERLRASEARYCSVVTHVKEVIFQTDLTGRWTFLNPSWTELTGCTVDESLGQLFLDYIHPDDREQCRLLFQPLIGRESDCCRHLTRYGVKGGDYRWVEVFARLTLDGAGKAIGVSGTLTDVTERKMTLERIRRQMLALYSSEEGIAWLDESGRFVRMNPALVKILGCQFENELHGRDWFSFFKETDVPLLAAQLRQVKADGSQWRGRVPGRRISGQLFPQEISLMAFPDGGFLCVCRDLTPQTEVGRLMLRNLAREQQLTELKSHFISTASHELRTPLAALSLGVDHIAKYWKALDADQITQGLQAAQAGVKQLRSMVEDLLVMESSEDGCRCCSRTSLDIVALCRELIAEAGVLDERRHPLTWHCRSETWLAPVDPVLLRHILSNLLSNACKFSPEGASVRVALEIQPDALVFSVADSGIGIPAEDQSRLFEFFFRASNAGDAPGMGMGLLVARRCAEAHGGSITVVSQAGRGSCFTLTLSRSPDARSV